MQKVKRVFLVGNGFNYLVAHIIKSHDGSGLPSRVANSKDACINNIEFLTRLWERFDEAFAELKKETKGLNEEELIGLVQCVINFLSCLEGLVDNIDINQIQKLLHVLLDKFLVQKIVEIAQDFKRHENIEEYKNIKQYFKSLPYAVESFIRENPQNTFNLYTTNYDGILETVFAKERGENVSGFLGEDGFIRKISENPPRLALDRSRLENEKIKFMHLHGSYKFTKHFGMTCKIMGNTKNQNPVMVFNRPEHKGNLVRGDEVLNTYFEKLRRDLSNCEKFIILGNSMRNEPHIKELIRISLNKDAEITVCSRRPEEIRDQINPYTRCKINLASTQDIITENDLTNFLIHLLS